MTFLQSIAIMVRSSEPNFQNMAVKKKKITPEIALDSAKQGAEKVTKAAGEVFGKLMGHLEPKKVDQWQKKWLAVPANRKKYEKVTDAPEVVGEELLEMTNDIIDFVQKKTTKPAPKKASKAPAKKAVKAPAKAKKTKK